MGEWAGQTVMMPAKLPVRPLALVLLPKLILHDGIARAQVTLVSDRKQKVLAEGPEGLMGEAPDVLHLPGHARSQGHGGWRQGSQRGFGH